MRYFDSEDGVGGHAQGVVMHRLPGSRVRPHPSIAQCPLWPRGITGVWFRECGIYTGQRERMAVICREGHNA